MQIEVLWFEGCPNHEGARALLDEVLTERGVQATIEQIEVPDLATGERLKFPGSPTIRVDGVDVEPDYVDGGDYTPRCRVYPTSAGLRGVPEKAWIEQAVAAAAR